MATPTPPSLPLTSDELLLHRACLPGIYRPRSQSWPDDQGKNTCESMSKLLHRFAISSGDAGMYGLRLRDATAALVGDSDDITIRWLGEYGCALIQAGTTRGCSDEEPDEVTFALVALDEHQFLIHASQEGREFASDSLSSSELWGAKIPASHADRFQGVFQDLLSKAQQRKGDERSAASNKQGHQRTPSFIFALMKDTWEVYAKSPGAMEGRTLTKPPGGFTDVGLHTGGKARSVCWALVKAVTLSLLQSHLLSETGGDVEPTFKRVLIDFDFWYIEQNFLEVGTDAIGWKVHYGFEVMAVLNSAAYMIAQLNDRGYDVTAQLEKCREVVERTDGLSSEYHKVIGETMVLPDLKDCMPTLKDMTLGLPEDMNHAAQAKTIDLEEARSRAEKELGRTSLLPSTSNSIFDLWDWMLSIKLESLTTKSCSLVFNTVERVFFSYAGRLSDDTLSIGRGEGSVGALEQVLDRYREVMVKFHAFQGSNGLMLNELRSEELLVVWIGYCVVHKMVSYATPLVEQYGVALRWTDLKHLLLSDKSAWDAVVAVKVYLHSYSACEMIPLFSMRNQVSTWAFAEIYGMADPLMNEVWEKECVDAKERKDVHWAEVQRKQALARQLRVEISSLEAEVSSLKTNERVCQSKLDEYRYCTTYEKRFAQSALDHAKTDLCKKRSELEDTKGRLRGAEKAPPPIFQPLPASKQTAMRMVFFLYMPADLRTLSRLSFSAQQQLLPRSPNSFTNAEVRPGGFGSIASSLIVTAVATSATFIDDYYRAQSRRNSDRPHQTLKVGLGSCLSAPLEWGPKHVDYCLFPEDGIWHPDDPALNMVIDKFLHMSWTGGGFALDNLGSKSQFNPFVIDDHVRAVSFDFMEELPGDCKDLQWAAWQPGSDQISANRGNRAIASQEQRPQWLSINQYKWFAKIRAFPNQQLGEVCCALQERSLPLQHPAVHSIIKQALFHLGELSRDPAHSFSWKMEHSNGSWLQLMEQELSDLAQELENAPRDRFALRLIAELAAFVSQWRPSCRDIARNIGGIAKRFASDLEAQIEKVPDQQEELVHNLRAKECIFIMYSIISHGYGPISADDAAMLCELSVRANNLRIFEEETDYDEEMRELGILCEHIMTDRVDEIIAGLATHLHRSLTTAVTVVINSTPQDLQWIHLGGACYEAVHEDRDLYSVNVLTGAVLLNGMPPRRLPKAILNHALYKRVFGDRNFETVADSQGTVILSARKIRGKTYEFSLGPSPTPSDGTSSALTIRELDEVSGVTLELLDATCGNEAWLGDLPIRLRTLHSHWFWQEKQVVVLRKVHFLDQTISWLLLRNTGSDAVANSWSCFSVPVHLMQQELGLAALYNVLVVDENPPFPEKLVHLSSHQDLLHVLAKFEKQEVIETYETDDGQRFRISLPRYGLGFQLDMDTGRLDSLDFASFALSKQQHLDDTLLGFSRYLVLEAHEGDAIKVLVPKGLVSASEHVNVDVVNSTACSERLQYYVYDVHPRLKILTATSIAARLQLAALYAAGSTELPDMRYGMRGSEVALTLVRQCWVDRPLSDEEHGNLCNLEGFCSQCPALSLLCHELHSSSVRLNFLYSQHKGRAVPLLNRYAASEYINEAYPRNARQALTVMEEVRILGSRRSLLGPSRKMPRFGQLSLDGPCPIPLSSVVDIQTALDGLLTTIKATEGKPFPLDLQQHAANKVGQKMMDDLEASWKADQTLPIVSLKFTLAETERILLVLSGRVKEQRVRVEDFCIRSIDNAASSADWHSAAFQSYKLCRTIPTVTVTDLLKIALNPSDIDNFNPFLTEEARGVLQESILLWMQLCVFEDKLTQMCCAMDESMINQLVRRLQVKRTWDVHQHPEWLVFEVEGQLEIRPIQYIVAKRLIDSEEGGVNGTDLPGGAIAQLNMGEGKTRVILPMLVLHFAKTGKQLVRLHFLGQLLGEAYEYLHQYLCASVLNRKLSLLPFNRDVEFVASGESSLTLSGATRVHILQRHLEFIRDSHGCVCVAPEHRLSLGLKWHEERRQEAGHATSTALSQLFIRIEYLDIFDESDEVLRHKFQLIYALGDKLSLPGGPSRWHAIQALLRIIDRMQRIDGTKSGGEVEQRKRRTRSTASKTTGQTWSRILGDPRVAVRKEQGVTPAEAFMPVRLIPGDDLEKHKKSFIQGLAQALMDDPPYEHIWMKSAEKGKKVTEEMLAFMTDPAKYDADDLLKILGAGSKEMEDLMALRGILACNLLTHCLEGRHRVHYGVKRPAKKHIAVPFRAADTPSARSEYGHPDVALVYTHLAYYSDGLIAEEVLEAFETLLKLGPSRQAKEYASWYDLSRHSMSATESSSLDDICKVDLSNDVQKALLIKYFCRNFETVNFWLAEIILPVETQQFPKRLVSNAWDLCSNPRRRPVGFSGTNDNKLLLPLQVEQVDIEDQELMATNGKMLRLLTREITDLPDANTYVSLPEDEAGEEGRPTWQRVLDYVATEITAAHALIDAGGLIAGISNSDVAGYLLPLLDSTKYKGVVFFENDRNAWFVRDQSGREWPLHSSPIRERDAFVFFDDRHCRGADMKLKIDAKAVLTVGPKLCKDKLMQAAGRMRQLDKGQQFVSFLGIVEVERQIREISNTAASTSSLRGTHVVQWTMHNTIVSVALEGMPEWAKQGIHFSFTNGRPEYALLDEKLRLEEFYGKEFLSQSALNILSGTIDEYKAVCQGTTPKGFLKQLVNAIKDRVKTSKASDYKILSTGLDEECERELEREVEVEQEEEVQIPKRRPVAEKEWNYASVFSLESAESVGGGVAIKLSTVISTRFDHHDQLHEILWSPSSSVEAIYATKNFISAVVDEQAADDSTSTGIIAQYLRPIDHVLIFKGLTAAGSATGSTALLLSEREADSILGLIWKRQGGSREKDPCLANLAYLRLAKTYPPKLVYRGIPDPRLPCSLLVTLQLFNGETAYLTEEQKACLQKMMESPRAKLAALKIPVMRGLQHMVSHSDLEVVSKL